MTTWTPTQQEMTAEAQSPRPGRLSVALTLVALALVLAAFDGLMVVRHMALPWEKGALLAAAVASAALGGALALRRKEAGAAEALAEPPVTGIVLTGSVASDVVLDYDAVRSARDPEATLLEFLASTYAAAANLGRWDRAALECAIGRPRKPRRVE